MMITIQVRAFARFREMFGDRFEVQVNTPATIHTVMMAVAKRNEHGLAELVDGEGRIKRSVIVLVNRERISGEEREQHAVNAGDEVAIYPPVAGG